MDTDSLDTGWTPYPASMSLVPRDARLAHTSLFQPSLYARFLEKTVLKTSSREELLFFFGSDSCTGLFAHLLQRQCTCTSAQSPYKKQSKLSCANDNDAIAHTREQLEQKKSNKITSVLSSTGCHCCSVDCGPTKPSGTGRGWMRRRWRGPAQLPKRSWKPWS